MPRSKPISQPLPRQNVADQVRPYRRDVMPVMPLHDIERVDDQRDEEEDIERQVREGDIA